jgi:type II secretory pathway pseudopilin PulG
MGAKKAAKGMKQTSFWKTKAAIKNNKSAITLIEIILVLALLGLLISSALPRINQISRANTRTAVRKIAALVKFCYDQSVLRGKLHRIVFDLGTKDNPNQSWDIEVATGDILPEEQLKGEFAAANIKNAGNRQETSKAPAAYEAAEDSSRHKKPNGIKIVSLRSWRLPENEAIKEGGLAVYCFPNGFIDDATLSIQEDGRPQAPIWHIKTRSLTGRVDIEVTEAPAQP